jgi:hypothetical protein
LQSFAYSKICIVKSGIEIKHMRSARKYKNTSSLQKKENPGKQNFFGSSDSKPFFQAKLTVNQPGDKHEQEADAMADQVMNVPTVQRKCADCEEEEKLQRKPLSEEMATVQRKETTNVPSVDHHTESAIHSSKGSGAVLPQQTRTAMEERFGSDFRGVKIHTDNTSSQLNHKLNAKAFTSGSDIYFREGEFNPDTDSGKRLLAHELTHVVQQKSIHQTSVQRCPAGQDADYDTVAAQIRALPLFLHPPFHSDAIYTPARTRQIANQIITDAKTRDNCMYYINFLHTLFSVPENPASTIGAQQGPILQQAAQDEQTRLQDPQAQQNAQFEENLSGAVAASNWTQLSGQGGVHYYVDRTDPTNIVVRVRVRLTGNATRVSQARSLEDAIEKHANTAGYTVDLQFVNTTGHDVFQAGVDPGAWATSGNWVGTPDVMAHELHHLLNLPDRYNYIEDHSGNADMYICNRIHWFLEEFNRPTDPNQQTSFMGYGNLVTDADICQVAQYTDQADCMRRREAIRQPFINMKMRALAKCLRVRNLLSGIVPGTILDPHNPDTAPADTSARVRQIAQQVFNATLSDDDIDRNVRNMEYQMRSPSVQMLVASSLQCSSGELHWQQTPSAYLVCPAFLALSLPDQQQALMKQAHLIYQNVSAEFVMDRIRGIAADESTALKWAQFALRVANEV